MREADHLWTKAATCFITERLWLHTMRLTCVRLTERSLSNVWWPVLLSTDDDADEKCLALWLNSSLGLLLLLGHRSETRGGWVDFKKPVLSSMPVLDVRKLSPKAKERLTDAYAEVAGRDLEPLPNMATDETRAAIDAAIAGELGLPNLSVLRNMLACEPVISLTLDRLMPRESRSHSPLFK
jgi:hypothetical protein